VHEIESIGLSMNHRQRRLRACRLVAKRLLHYPFRDKATVQMPFCEFIDAGSAKNSLDV